MGTAPPGVHCRPETQMTDPNDPTPPPAEEPNTNRIPVGQAPEVEAAPPGLSPADIRYLRRAIELAERGRGRTSPNPMVGCVLVRSGQVVGEGWHQRHGEAHAEAAALAQAGEAARGATAYVNLEPCDHQGLTPPCSAALIEAGVVRVVYASPDPDPRVAGKGADRLRSAGVEVVAGALRKEADALNAAYLVHRHFGRPWVRYKTAMTLDGKIATRTGRSRWITGAASRALVQGWRNQADAIAVGVNTVLQDDPALTTRLEGDAGPGRTARKVVFDALARTPLGAKLFEPGPDGDEARVTVIAGERAPDARVRDLEGRGASVLRLPGRPGHGDGGRPDATEALRRLAADGVVEMLLEGGGTLAWSFLEAGLIDRVAWFLSPKLVGGRGAPPLSGLGVASLEQAVPLLRWDVQRVGGDLLIEGDVDPQPLAMAATTGAAQATTRTSDPADVAAQEAAG